MSVDQTPNPTCARRKTKLETRSPLSNSPVHGKYSSGFALKGTTKFANPQGLLQRGTATRCPPMLSVDSATPRRYSVAAVVACCFTIIPSQCQVNHQQPWTAKAPRIQEVG
jgi:hypothetical protein